ncbi:FKBP-type peptidyl-prolyl cis-trans isomerase [Longispora albida]|uniref:FKBP-type peptidyl-prolyl cis-trans isomerase n=1 Tax=Longispora albida TaxID=203523 RepID=UPI000475B5C6|nr:FKBP-type peptidyl-prolyl cis-trans isomerase [Longispora albida]
MRIVKTAVLLTVLASAAACGGADGKGSKAAANRPCTIDDVTVAGATGSRPSITIKDGCTPGSQLLTKDLNSGEGPAVKRGDTVDTHYELKTWSDKQDVDSSWTRNQPFPVQNVGKARVITGWNEGLIGMKEGGRRLLIVPPDKGYGAEGSPPIKGAETLVFVIDAVKVTGAGS